jgi:uncharacterized protein DUF6934
MLPKGYEYKKVRDLDLYEFMSEGPKGKIRKVIVYSLIDTEGGHAYYNLGFGDYRSASKRIDDLAVSDNKDLDKVLATVAATTVEFMRHHPGSRILIKGSTPVRTRLYQMQIAAHFQAISEIFDIQCLTKEQVWVEYRRGENFEGFLVEKL